MTTTLNIRHTWDGQPIPETEVARVELELGPHFLDLRIDAPFHEDPPPPGEPGPTDELWKYEVVEVFIAGAKTPDGEPAYLEIELSPHGHHLVLELRGVRRIVRKGLPLEFRARRSDDGRWHGRARLATELLPRPPYKVNAYAIHGRGADRRYLAAYPVPGDSPDFHQPERFRPLL